MYERLLCKPEDLSLDPCSHTKTRWPCRPVSPALWETETEDPPHLTDPALAPGSVRHPKQRNKMQGGKAGPLMSSLLPPLTKVHTHHTNTYSLYFVIVTKQLWDKKITNSNTAPL